MTVIDRGLLALPVLLAAIVACLAAVVHLVTTGPATLGHAPLILAAETPPSDPGLALAACVVALAIGALIATRQPLEQP